MNRIPGLDLPSVLTFIIRKRFSKEQIIESNSNHTKNGV